MASGTPGKRDYVAFAADRYQKEGEDVFYPINMPGCPWDGLLVEVGTRKVPRGGGRGATKENVTEYHFVRGDWTEEDAEFERLGRSTPVLGDLPVVDTTDETCVEAIIAVGKISNPGLSERLGEAILEKHPGVILKWIRGRGTIS